MEILSWARGVEAKGVRSHPPKRYFEFYSLCQLIDGEGIYAGCDEVTRAVPLGGLILSCPRDLHRYGPLQGHSWKEDFITFRGELLDHMRDDNLLFSGLFAGGEKRRLLPLIEMVQNPDPVSQIRAGMMLVNLLLELIQGGETEDPATDNTGNKIQELLTRLRLNPGETWTVEEMADFCDLSTSRFREVFRQRLGMPPKVYVDRLRIRLAAECLLNTRLPIREVARRFAFPDAYYFSRRFRQLMGCSPRDYRNHFRRGAGCG